MYDGHEIFKLVDTYGLPLDIINLILREEGSAFNAAQFIESAYRAGWKKERILWMMRVHNPKVDSKLEEVIDYLEPK